MPDFILQELPPTVDLETKPVMRQAAQAHRFLAELKGVSKTIPNQSILINTLPLLEAKDSSAIENIITTHDELYKEDLFGEFIQNAAAKEVRDYSVALRHGFESVKHSGLLTNNLLLDMHKVIENNSAGFRKLPGTKLKNDLTGETVYVPPQNTDDVARLMANLERFINDDEMSPLDPLVKMAIIHHQFESIHPFYDGNGRAGRIINILYLVQKGLLDIPVLYLSRYIIKTKGEYYRLLQTVRDEGAWEEWLLYMLRGIEDTSKNTVALINAIRDLMQDYKNRIRSDFKFYSQDLLNNLFSHPYTKIEFIERDLGVTRQTAAKYLDELADSGLLVKEKIGRYNFYINKPLFDMFLKG
ncbi:MAG: filamentation induced by cAMP protein fic [Nitrospirae bacterium]|nr:MAG: filamentation induced by cAMP protein fic [Nitrospirota bacterium]